MEKDKDKDKEKDKEKEKVKGVEADALHVDMLQLSLDDSPQSRLGIKTGSGIETGLGPAIGLGLGTAQGPGLGLGSGLGVASGSSSEMGMVGRESALTEGFVESLAARAHGNLILLSYILLSSYIPSCVYFV